MFVRTLFAALAALCFFAGPARAQAPGAAGTDLVIPAGGITLKGRLFAPPGRERFPVVVLVSGSGNQSELGDRYTLGLADAFNEAGIGVVAYDKRGVGGSTGVYTGADFSALGDDAAAVVSFTQRLPQAESVGIWGISQAGWIIPYAVQRSRGLRFAILVSPAGVNPFDQIAYFLRGQLASMGLTQEEVAAADRMHRVVTLYYAGRSNYAAAQAAVDANRDARWFQRVVTHPYWDDMTPDHSPLNPEQLAQAIHERPGGFEFRDPNNFRDYSRRYRALRRVPTLIIYGGADAIVPTTESGPIFARALRGERRHDHSVRTFEGADHMISTPDGRLAPGYLDAMTEWAAVQFARG